VLEQAWQTHESGHGPDSGSAHGALPGSSPVLEVVWLTQVAEAVPQQSMLSDVDVPATAKLLQFGVCSKGSAAHQ